jgi:hypothetical protein
MQQGRAELADQYFRKLLAVDETALNYRGADPKVRLSLGSSGQAAPHAHHH